MSIVIATRLLFWDQWLEEDRCLDTRGTFMTLLILQAIDERVGTISHQVMARIITR